MKKKTIKLLMTICILVALGSAGYLCYYYGTSAKVENQFQRLRELVLVDENIQSDTSSTIVDGVKIQKKFEQLYNKNNDFIGWICIADTKIDYPVMHTPQDNENGEYYIHRDFEKNYSAVGLPFIDKNCGVEVPTDNIIIYGHNMNSGTMFHDIMKYQDDEFYQQHKTFTFNTIYEDGTYEVVAAFYGEILPDDSNQFKYYEFVNAGTEEEFLNYIEEIKTMSIIDTNVEVEYGDELITLSTCSYHVKDGRFALIGKKINK